MIQVSIHQAKTHLSKLIQKTHCGDDVLILKRAQPVARIVAIKSCDPAQRIGGLKSSLYKMGDNFDDPALNAALAESFYSPSSPRIFSTKKTAAPVTHCKKAALKKRKKIIKPHRLTKKAHSV
jgi:prevent-host-death family protein